MTGSATKMASININAPAGDATQAPQRHAVPTPSAAQLALRRQVTHRQTGRVRSAAALMTARCAHFRVASHAVRACSRAPEAAAQSERTRHRGGQLPWRQCPSPLCQCGALRRQSCPSTRTRWTTRRCRSARRPPPRPRCCGAGAAAGHASVPGHIRTLQRAVGPATAARAQRAVSPEAVAYATAFARPPQRAAGDHVRVGSPRRGARP